MVVVSHNLLAANANRQLGITTEKQKKSTEKLSSGYRINRAADDAAGLSISEKLRYQIRGLERGEKNTMDGVSWCQIGDGALQEVEEMVQRIRELAVQASNDTNTPEDRIAIDNEVQQLRKEINQTSYNAMFNTQHIFYSKEASFGVMGVPDDLQVYTANTKINDPNVNTDNYGGVIFDGNRIPWSSISSQMVDVSDTPDTFNGGTYDWQDPTPGSTRKFTLRVDEDDTGMPNYTREIDISADISKGVIVDGEVIPWAQVKDENGVSMSDATKHDGIWMFDYHGAKVGFSLTGIEDMDDVVREISDPHMGRKSYSWETPYTGLSTEQAVDAATNRTVQVTNKMQQTLYKNKLLYNVKADQDGVSLLDSHRAVVPNSQKTWKELFGAPAGTNWEDWVKGGLLDAQKGFTYTFTDIEGGSHDTDLAFTFSMTDITGLDDVIEGLNGMPIYGDTMTSYLAVDAPANASNHVKVVSSAKISYEDERALGRDFDTQMINNVSTGSFSYTVDPVNHTVGAQLKFPDGSGVTMKGTFQDVKSEADLEAKLMDGVDAYVDSIIKEQTNRLLTGKTRPFASCITSLSASVASGNDSYITSTIYYDHKDLISKIKVEMKDAADGAYVKNADGTTYRAYDPATDGAAMPPVQRYNIDVSFDGAADKADLIAQHKAEVFDKTVGANGAKVQLNATDFTYATTRAQENPNSANRSNFKSVVKKTPLRSGIHIQNSSNVGDYIIIPQFAMNTVELGIFGINTRTYDDSQMAIDACDYAISVVNECRGIFGAAQNRLEHTYNNSTNAEENQQAAESRIRDTDMAKEMVNYSKNNILAQAGQSMLAQANQGTQGILSLLQ